MNVHRKDCWRHLLLFVTGSLLLFSIPGCRPRRTDPLAYVVFPLLRGGLTRPEAPKNLHGNYDPFAGTITLNWSASIDPDTGRVVPVYKVYLYLNAPPQHYYLEKNLIKMTDQPTLILAANPFNYPIYFVVTAFDGWAESLPSNTVEIRGIP